MTHAATAAITLPAPGLRAARWATRVEFAVFGFATGTWGANVPAAKAHFGLDAAGIATALLAAAIGAVLCLSFAGRAVAALGARRVAQGAGLAMCAALAATLQVDRVAALWAVMAVFGGAGAWFDVAINAEASVLETRSGKKVMSGFHGMFSAGGMAGAGTGAWLIAAGVPAALQVAAAGGVLAVLLLGASTSMLDDDTPPPGDPGTPASARRGRRAPLLVLGALAAIGLVAEGAMYDWSVLYLRIETGAAPALAPLGYASFSAAMAATRFAGDALRTRVAPARLLAGSALLAAVAMAAVLLVRDPVVALIGFALVGAGFANVVPIIFIAAARVPGTAPAAAIATVSSVGYLGFVVGPPLVGAITQAESLTAGLGVVVVGALLLAAGARWLPR